MHLPARLPRPPARPPAAALASLAAALLSLPAPGASVEARMTSSFLLRGERAQLQVIVEGEVPDRAPRLPEAAGLTIRTEDAGRPRTVALGRRRVGYVYTYTVLSYDLGRHRIPPITVDVAGQSLQTRALPTEVFDPGELRWTDLRAGTEAIRCGAAFRVGDPMPFVNECVPVELKLYVPADARIEDWGIPEFERDGLAAWRFEPNRTRSHVVLNGRAFSGIAYPSTLTPTRSGSVAIGPARLRLVLIQLTLDVFGPSPAEFPLWVDVPAVPLDARPLPAGAPEGFSNAVGSFTVTATAESNEVREGDPVVVNLDVAGTGNLDALDPPAPLEAEGWRLYDAAAMPRGDERRDPAGSIRFRQFMRPLELKPRIPPFRFVFFDPDREEYRTLLTDPIALRMLPSAAPPAAGAAPPPAAAVPVERMTDILGAIPVGPPARRSNIPWPLVWQALPAAAVAALLLRIATRRLAPLLRRDPLHRARRRALEGVARAPAQPREFYRAVGAFIERWLGDRAAADPQLAGLLADRDLLCFDPAKTDARLAPGERRKVLRTLRRHLATLALALALTFAAAPAGARAGALEPAGAAAEAAAAYADGRFAEAARLWLDAAPFDRLDADRLYNIGNCWFRLGSAGQAALYYRRALARAPGHAEARQNLRFIERKFGSLTVKRPDYQYVLARLPLAFWQGLVWAGAWLLAIGLLCIPACRPFSRGRLAGVVAIVLAPIAAGVGGLGWRYFPDDAEFAPVAQQAVVTADDAVVFADASRTSPEVIDAPPGSLCRIVAARGRWVYVAFATRTRGWLPSNQLEPIAPRTTPDPPSAIRPKAGDGST